MPIGNTIPIVKLATKQISLNTNTKQDFVLLEDDLLCYVTGFQIRKLSGPIVLATLSFGWNANADNILPLSLYSTILNNGKDYLMVPLTAPAVTGKLNDSLAAKVGGVLQNTTLIVDAWGWAE